MQAFSSEEQALARSEGWAQHGDTVRILTDANGVYRFSSSVSLYVFLYNKAKTSAFHFNVYCDLYWNSHDVIIARQYGFFLWPPTGTIEDRTGYTSAEEHMARIAKKAPTDPVCAKALRIMTKYRLISGDPEWLQSD